MHGFTCKVVLCKGLSIIDKKTNSLHGTNRAIERGRHTRRLLAILPYLNCMGWSITTMPLAGKFFLFCFLLVEAILEGRGA